MTYQETIYQKVHVADPSGNIIGSISQAIQRADDRIVTLNYTDSTKSILSTTVYSSQTVRSIYGMGTLTITYTSVSSTQEQYSYALSV